MSTTPLHPAVDAWFVRTFGAPTEAQRLAWPAIARGESTLVAAPTGSGKTLAAFLATLSRLVEARAGGAAAAGTSVLYVSPLKALSTDIHVNLEEPLRGISEELERLGMPMRLTAALRTGDTTQAARAALVRAKPDIVVTTPESLYLMLTSESGRRTLCTVRTVIVDEIHALAGNKRGSHLALSLERLEALAGAPLLRIGLSATQRPIEVVAGFLMGAGRAPCRIVDVGHRRDLDVALELPRSPLAAVMSKEVWQEVHERLCELVREHRTTLVFVNTRRLAERLTRELGERLGHAGVTSHHGSLSKKLREDAERRLRAGELSALVATSSLELGIDVGPIDLVCQVGVTRSIATFLQRVGRAEHRLRGVPKGRLFPLSRDELVESAALLWSVRQGALDALAVPEAPLDILAQQVVAEAATRPCGEDELYALVRRAYPYRALSRSSFDAVLDMLASGFSTKRGRRGALVHRDVVVRELRARRGARLVALTSGGAIPDNADYQVVLEPTGTVVGSVNEDFAVESMAGDVFQLGNTSWRILRVESGRVRVEDAGGQPPSIPFWLGEAPGRSRELSQAVSVVRERLDELLPHDAAAASDWLVNEAGVDRAGAEQLVEYLAAAKQALGTLPTLCRLVAERFFDESGGMQLVIHTVYGSRINRAYGLALRKVFCRTFNFELQAAATEDAIVLSLGAEHSFPLADVFRFLRPAHVRDVLVQALLAAPMFQTRWRWNATRALALPRTRGGKRTPAPLVRMQAEDLVAAVFPDQLACAENLVGERQVPDHPLVAQTIDDCLHEAMDLDGLMRLLADIDAGAVTCVARDLPEPSPLAHEILSARPYAFLDDAPLEERRARAVMTRRGLGAEDARELGALDVEAIARVRAEVWPEARDADELYDALMGLGVLHEHERAPGWSELCDELMAQGRAARLCLPSGARPWVCLERLGAVLALHPGAGVAPPLSSPPELMARGPGGDVDAALLALVRERLEASGPLTANALAQTFEVSMAAVEGALGGLEAEGFVLRGAFSPGEQEREWCERRVLARIHRLTVGRLRAEIEPVSVSDYLRFLFVWQRVAPGQPARGQSGLEAVLPLLDGFEAPAAAWESELLARRVADYDPAWLDAASQRGLVAWGRLRAAARAETTAPRAGPMRSSPIALCLREHLDAHLALGTRPDAAAGAAARRVHEALQRKGASFFSELCKATGLLPSQVEDALAELCSSGLVTSDGLGGLRALLAGAGRDAGRHGATWRRQRRSRLELSGRWSPLAGEPIEADAAKTVLAHTLLLRYGVLCRAVLAREGSAPPWRELLAVLRRLEARGELRGGRFVEGPGGEQFAHPDAVALLRRVRRERGESELVTVCAADPVSLVGILTPGPRVPATARNRVLFAGGSPVAYTEGGHLHRVAGGPAVQDSIVTGALEGPRRRRGGGAQVRAI